MLSRFWTRIKPFARTSRPRALYGINSFEQFRTILERERARADRNAHQFSVIVFDVHNSEVNGNQAKHLVRVLTNRIRFTDELGWFDNHRIAALLPETPAVGASALADDVRQTLTGDGSPPECAVYTYPSRWSNGGDGHPEQSQLSDILPEHSAAGVERTATDDTGERQAEPLEELFCRSLPIWKRDMDIVGATVALTVFSPIMVAVAIAIKLTSKGPVIFKQQRAGLGGRPFTFYKFRSMVVDAEARKKDILKHNERTGPAFKMTDDPRVTHIGTFLRKWSLDELPQLFNVLKGDLSLVGPRPLPIEEASQHDRWQNRRLHITPGITCLWQIYARHDKSFDRWARLDIEYISRQSLLLDVEILLKTLPAVLSRKGAC